MLITGASSGIGAATAKYLGILAATLALTGRSEDILKMVSNEYFATKYTKAFTVN